MPTAPPRPCRACGALRCQRHGARSGWAERPPQVERQRGRKLQAARRRLFARQPFCEPCEQRGRLTLATIRDHRVPLAEGGADDAANEQAICMRCHTAKTRAEATRGKERRRW